MTDNPPDLGKSTSIADYSATELGLIALRDKHKNLVLDVSTTKGMTVAKEARAEIRTYRVNLEKLRVEIKAPALERCRLIDAEAKRITEELLKLETPIDEAIKAEEARKEVARKAREDAEKERLAQIERDRLAAERAEAERVQREKEEALAAERASLAAERAEFERQQAEAAAAEKARREEADAALARERAAEAEKLAAERNAHRQALEAEAANAKAERDRLAQERALEHEARVQADREAAAERERLAAAERDRLMAERLELDRRQAEERQKAYQQHLDTLRANSTDLLKAAIDAHKLLLEVEDGVYADDDVTVALGFAIEHNSAQQQLPLPPVATKPTKKPRKKKGEPA
jgi:hypothetical protein